MSMLGNNLGTFEEKQNGQLFDFQTTAHSCSTRSRGRTGTASRPLVFETNASTDSAIRADACW